MEQLYKIHMVSSLPWQRNSIILLCSILLAACGAPSDADLAVEQQQALIATVAAAPTSAVDTMTNLAATSTTTALPTATLAKQSSAVPSNIPTQPETAVPAPPPPTSVGLAAQATNVPQAVAATAESSEPPQPSPVPSTATPTIAATAIVESPSPAPPTPAPITAGATTELAFSELYSGASITGPVISDKADQLNGSKVVMVGYMAPPLKPDLDFFVLTKDPMVYCPFCSSAADWPFDIVFVRMADGSVPALTPTQAIRVTGTFQTGTATDAATGFVSQIRISADKVETFQ